MCFFILLCRDIPRQMRPVTVTVTSLSSLCCTFCSMERPHRGQKEPGSDPGVSIRQFHFFLRIPLSLDGVDSFLPTRKPNYNHSATKGLKPCSIPCKVLGFLIAVVQPSRSESFTMRRAYIYPMNRH